MVKIFSRLFFMIFTLLLTAFTIGEIVREQAYLSIYIEDLRKLHTTPAILIKEELAQISPNQWSNKITQLQTLFGYPIQLTQINNSVLSQFEVDILIEQQSYGDIDNNTLHYMIADCHCYLSLGPIFSGTALYLNESQREAIGVFKLIEQQLNNLPRAQWFDKIEQLNQKTFFPMRLIELASVELVTSQLKKLKQGQIIFDENGNNKIYIYKRLINTNLVIMADDISQTEQWYYELISELIYPFLLLAAIVATLFWVKPFWRDMEKINTAINSFNHGKFNHKVITNSTTQLKPLADSFNHLSTKVEQLIQGNKDLSNAVSHELKTPLSNIIFSVALLRETDINSEKHLSSIDDDVSQLSDLIDEFLSYAKFQYARPKLNIKPTTLAGLTNTIKSKPSASLSVILDKQTSIVECDLFYMQRALDNVLSNAFKYAKSLIVIKVVQCEYFYSIIVDDDGCGIQDLNKKRMLLPFERDNTSENQNIKGTGFGLAIVNTILSWHSGQVHIEDSSQGGTRVKLRWPISIV